MNRKLVFGGATGALIVAATVAGIMGQSGPGVPCMQGNDCKLGSGTTVGGLPVFGDGGFANTGCFLDSHGNTICNGVIMDAGTVISPLGPDTQGFVALQNGSAAGYAYNMVLGNGLCFDYPSCTNQGFPTDMVGGLLSDGGFFIQIHAQEFVAGGNGSNPRPNLGDLSFPWGTFYPTNVFMNNPPNSGLGFGPPFNAAPPYTYVGEDLYMLNSSPQVSFFNTSATPNPTNGYNIFENTSGILEINQIFTDGGNVQTECQFTFPGPSGGAGNGFGCVGGMTASSMTASNFDAQNTGGPPARQDFFWKTNTSGQTTFDYCSSPSCGVFDEPWLTVTTTAANRIRHVTFNQSPDTSNPIDYSWGGLFVSYNGISLTANGVPTIVANNGVTGVTTAQASVATVTAPNDGVNHNYDVKGFVNITAFTAGSINFQVSYTDFHSTAQTLTIPLANSSTGAFAAAATATGMWPANHTFISVAPNTSITVKTTGTFTTLTYDVVGDIQQIQ